MIATIEARGLSYQDRLDALRAAKLAQTQEKQRVVGSMDHDDWALILPPPERRKIVKTISGSGMEITDVLLDGYEPTPNHPSGGWFGPKAVGENFGRLLEAHPPYVDAMSSLAGGYFVNFLSYRKVGWRPDMPVPDDLREIIKTYQLNAGIGAAQHFCQDLAIGLELGWQGIGDKIARGRQAHPDKADFYDGLEAVVRGMQAWIRNNAAEARRQADGQDDPLLRENLLEIAEMNERLATAPPVTFREACQWMLWFQMAARMYNGSGSLGQLDALLRPFYQRDIAAGTLSDEEAVFHIACLLVRDTAYIQLGGPDECGRDLTSRVSYLVLEACHLLRIPANVGVAVGPHVDEGLLRRGLEIMFQDKTGIPKFLAAENTARDFTKNGYPLALGRRRVYSGCHWLAIPGREYTLNDCVKINLAAVFEVAWRDMLGSKRGKPSVARLYETFRRHLRKAAGGIARGLDFHLANSHKVMPEMVMDLLCHGPIEKGEDASHGGVEFYNMCVDAAGLATVADSFAALQQRIETEGAIGWQDMARHIEGNWSGPQGERARLMMRGVPRYGSGGSPADRYATDIARMFTNVVSRNRTPGGVRMVPGIFSWAAQLTMGAGLGATPNGRRKGEAISHGASPDPGFRKDGAPTAMAVAVAAVQPRRGNTAPMQIELDPMLPMEAGGLEHVMNLVKTHFELGGTQINMNIVDRATVLEAHADPSRHPDLVVRVTGFSAYFASLSKEFRELVVERMIS